jgi:predicted small lipoprotein YifL
LSAFPEPRLARLAVIGALLAALAASGCGRKGGLDPPPAPAIVEPATVAPDAQAQVGPGAPAPVGPDGRPVMAPPPPPKRWTPLDILVD